MFPCPLPFSSFYSILNITAQSSGFSKFADCPHSPNHRSLHPKGSSSFSEGINFIKGLPRHTTDMLLPNRSCSPMLWTLTQAHSFSHLCLYHCSSWKQILSSHSLRSKSRLPLLRDLLLVTVIRISWVIICYLSSICSISFTSLQLSQGQLHCTPT